MWNNAIKFQIMYVSTLLMRNKWINISLCNYIFMKTKIKYLYLTIWKMLWVNTIFKMATAVSLLLQIGLFGPNKWCSMGENAFHMGFQERWVFSHSTNPALAATRLWAAGYCELVGENSISPGKPCEMHII